MNLHQLGAFSLQFITQKNEKYNHLEAAELALKADLWIQLRMKEASWKRSKRASITAFMQKGAILIIDDHGISARKLEPTVHLGKMDVASRCGRFWRWILIGGTVTPSESENKG